MSHAWVERAHVWYKHKGIPYRAQGGLGLERGTVFGDKRSEFLDAGLAASRRAPEAAQFVLVFE